MALVATLHGRPIEDAIKNPDSETNNHKTFSKTHNIEAIQDTVTVAQLQTLTCSSFFQTIHGETLYPHAHGPDQGPHKSPNRGANGRTSNCLSHSSQANSETYTRGIYLQTHSKVPRSL